MGEWFRGIAPGGPAPNPRDVHDLGPGTYFTDTSSVAADYAKFRANDSNLKANQRTVYPAVLYGNFAESTLGPILDLTSGPEGQAWREFEEASYVGVTNRQIMKTNPERYGPMFKDWAAKRGLNLNQYVAIIGPEYLRGGRQLCIRNPDVADRVVESMVGRSVYAPPPVHPIGVSMTYSVRGQANAGAMVVAFMIVDAVATYFNGLFQEAEAKAAVTQDLRSVRDWQGKHPEDGALIVITFRRTVLNSEFMQNKVLIQPGDAFEYTSIYFAPSPEGAIKQMSVEKEWVQGDTINGPYKTVRRKQGIWIVPRRSEEEIFHSPVGKWQVSIGDWKAWFVFRNGGGCAWSESGGAEHKGTWKTAGNEVQWTYSDDPPGWERIFHARLPLKKKVSGEATIKGVNHGYYTMSKVT